MLILKSVIYHLLSFLHLGMCGFNVAQTRNNANLRDAFQLGAVTTMGLVGEATSAGVANCHISYILIPNTDVVSPRYCGSVLTGTDKNTVAGLVSCKYHSVVFNLFFFLSYSFDVQKYLLFF